MQKIDINLITENPENPRTIKDSKFKKLVQSLKDFPDMARVRPIVVNKDMVTLGGNMRLRAMRDAGWTECFVQVVDWPEEQQKEFIIKDNVSFGEWDWDALANEWDTNELDNYGLDLPSWKFVNEINEMSENDLDMTEDFDPIGTSSGLQRVVFIFDGPEEADSYLNSLSVKFKKMNMAWQVDLSTRSIL